MNATRIPEDEQRFAISRVAEICGTTPSTLRSWERRYGFPAPPRRGSGHRVYTREEVELIREVVARTQRGVAVSLAIEDVRQQASAATKIAPLKPAELVSRFVDAVQALDIASARAIFRQAWEMLDWDTLAREFIMPAMREIGDRWHAGQLSVAAEHMASSLVRTHVLSVIRFLGDQQDGPEAICACAPDEQHDLGLLMLSADLRRRGWQVMYLGAAVPIEELACAVALAQPHAVFISATTIDSARALRRLPEALRERDVTNARIIIGGGAPELHELLGDLPPLRIVEEREVEHVLEALESEWRGQRLTALR